MRAQFGFLVALALVFGGVPSAHALTLTVDHGGDTDDIAPGDGLCEDEDGRCTLRAAVQEANRQGAEDVEILLAVARIDFVSGAIGSDPINAPGTAITFEARNGGTVLIGAFEDVQVNAKEHDRVFDVETGAEVGLANFTVTGGAASGSGGGMRIASGATVTLVWMRFVDNEARVETTTGEGARGGAIGLFNAELTVQASIFENNLVQGHVAEGGAIWVGGASAEVYLDRSVFAENRTVATRTLTRSMGGAVNVDAGSVGIVNCTFSGNTAEGAIATGGGGLSVRAAGGATEVGIIASTFTRNTTNAGNGTVLPGLFSRGGGIYLDGPGTLSIQSSLFVENVAQSPDSILSRGPDCFVGPLAGRSIRSWGSNIFSDREEDECPLIDETGDANDQVFSESGILDPVLRNNGGGTLTHAISSGSPAAAAGNCSTPDGEFIETDQRGVARPDACDVGAFQRDAPEAICDDFRDNDGDGSVDCADDDCVDDPACEFPEVSCTDGFDNDADGDFDCEDEDCAGSEPCMNIERACEDGLDNDGDGDIDCADESCESQAVCGGEETVCGNGVDDDGDGEADCADEDCEDAEICETIETRCDDGVDNDGDGDVDCDDVNCSVTPECVTRENCEDEADNDGDNLVDCADPDCAGTGLCETVERSCGDAFDNDADGVEDCDDPDCEVDALCGGVETLCADGGDDDRDGLTDCFDPDCDSSADCANFERLCDDGLDNDDDGDADCADDNCVGQGRCEATERSCGDGFDNDADGVLDCADTDCANAQRCTGVEVSCENGVDDDEDGFSDCEDADCLGAEACAVAFGGGGGCATSPGGGSGLAALWLLLGLGFAGYALRRRPA